MIVLQDQWQRKKQTKAEKRAAKLAKLDPSNRKSAKDVLDDNERKRKRELSAADGEDDVSDLERPGMEKPREGMKTKANKPKKQKTDHSKDGSRVAHIIEPRAEDGPEMQEQRARKRGEREQRRQDKAARQKAKVDAKRSQGQETKAGRMSGEEQGPGLHDGEVTPDPAQDMDALAGLETQMEDPTPSSPSLSSRVDSPLSVESAQPSASSTSSIVPLTSADDKATVTPGKIAIPKVDKEELRARLEARIQALRDARNADGPNGKPARNRQELLEARRKKEEQRKAHKKELRKQAKEDEMKSKTEAELARLRGSGSPLTTPDIFSPRSPPDMNNFSFGRVNFQDGQSMDPSLSNLQDHRKRKGPSDALTAFNAAQKNHARVSGLDAAKRADIEEKDAWLNAKKKAHGERPKDDLSLLKKTLKRKQKAKMKSEKEWTNRIEGVQKGKEARQRKREDNLRKRKDEKGGKGKKTKGVKTKKKARPGFEGSFRGK